MLIGVTGKAGSGKDTFAKYFIEHHNFTRYSFAEPIKRMIQAGFGVNPDVWDDRQAKETNLPWLGRSPRYLAQTLGTEWGRELVHGDLWLLIAEEITKDLPRVIIPDVRFDNEAEWILNRGGIVVQVTNRSLEADNQAHASEAGVDPLLVSTQVRNDGTIEDLRGNAYAVWLVAQGS